MLKPLSTGDLLYSKIRRGHSTDDGFVLGDLILKPRKRRIE